METGRIYFSFIATLIFRNILAKPSIEIVSDDRDEHTAIMRCIADNTIGTPEIQFQYELFHGDPPEITILDSHFDDGSGSLSALIEVPQYGWIFCYVTDYEDTYYKYIDLNTEVCPSEHAIHVSQHAEIARPHGIVTLNCYFRFERDHLLSYMWMDDEKNAPVYRYTVADDTETIYKYGLHTNLVRNVTHKVTQSTVNSSIVMFIKSRHAFKCEVTLKNGNHDCAEVLSIKFQDPKINIEIKEDRDDGKIITCATNETIGETNITLNNVNVNGEVLTTERLHQSRRPPILYAKNTIAMGDVMMFVCDVADDVGNYRTKLNWHSNNGLFDMGADSGAGTSQDGHNLEMLQSYRTGMWIFATLTGILAFIVIFAVILFVCDRRTQHREIERCFVLKHENYTPIRGIELFGGSYRDVSVMGGIRVHFTQKECQSSPEFKEDQAFELLQYSDTRLVNKVETTQNEMIDYLCVYTDDGYRFEKDFSGTGGQKTYGNLGCLIAVKGVYVCLNKHTIGITSLDFEWCPTNNIAG